MADVFTYDGTTLSTYSVTLNPSKSSGLRRLASFDHDLTTMRQRDNYFSTYKGRRGGTMKLGGWITGTSRANYESNVTSFKQLIRPVVSGGAPVFKALVWDQLSSKRLYVLTLDMDIQDINDHMGEVSWELLRYPFWQGTSLTTEAATDGDLVLNNPGDVEATPVWTVTVLKAAGLASGYTFTCNGTQFQYTGALAQNDVLLVDSAAKTVKLNGTLDYANVGSTSGFPSLAVGNSTVSGRTCADADATLSASFYAEYEV